MITREEIVDLLLRWQAGEIASNDVVMAAEGWTEAIGELRFPETDPRSITADVVELLELLFSQSVIREDVPTIIRYLRTSPGKEGEAREEFNRYWKSIDYWARKPELD